MAKNDIKNVQVPIMFLSAQLDLLVPPFHMTTLFNNAPDTNELTRIHRFPMGGHNDTPLKETKKYYAAFQQYFLDLGIHCVPVPKPDVGGSSKSGSDDVVAVKAAAAAVAATAAAAAAAAAARAESGHLEKID